MSLVSSTAKISSNTGFYDFPINQSLRFDGTGYLSRTFGSGGSTTTWTLSLWLKRTMKYTNSQGFFRTSDNSFVTRIEYAHNLQSYYTANGTTFNFIAPTVAVYRDPSAWYHFVIVYNSTSSTNTEKYKVIVNNQTQDFASPTYPTTGSSANSATTHYLGGPSPETFDGYMANIQFLDGQALDASYFGETKSGVWIPKAYTGSYGTNGFHLTFEDATSTTTLGYDYSGNNNHWTLN